MNTRRAALLAALLSVLFFVGPGIIPAGSIVNAARVAHGLSQEFFAIKALVHFSTGTLMNLLGYQALTVAVVLWGLGSRKQ